VNPHLCRVVLRPRGPLEVFDLCLRFVRERAAPLAKLTAITVLPPWLVVSIVAWFLDGEPWTALLVVPAMPLIQAPFTVLGGRMLFSDDVAIGVALRDTLGRLSHLAAAWAVSLLAVLVAILSCAVLLIPVQAGMLYLGEATLLERVGPRRALRRTTRLASSHAGMAFVGAVSRYALAGWCALVAEASGQALFSTVLQVGTPFGSLFDGQVTPFLVGGLLLSAPLHALYRLLLYVDVRTRVEGWDLHVGLRAAAMGSR